MTSRSSVHLLWGEDAFLLREEAFELLGDIQPTEVDAAEWVGGETADLATPSLFGEKRALLVNDCRSLPDHALGELKNYLQAPAPDAPLVLLAVVRERERAPGALVKLVEPVGEVRGIALQRKELQSWVMARAKRKGIEIAPEAARELVDTVADPAALDQALDQLTSAFPGRRITAEDVASQFKGLAEQRVWDLCDRAFSKDLPGAIRSLSSLLDAREDSLAVLGGIASRVRELMRVRVQDDRLSLAELAKRAGLRFDWQARRYREQARRFTLQELEGIHDRIVEADRVLKTGATGDVVLPVLVVAVAEEK